MEARLQKVLSQWGVASRRHAEEMIRQSRVRINGATAQVGQKVDPERDVITVDGKTITTDRSPSLIYLLLNKPVGVVSTCNDPQGRTTVLDLLPNELRSGQGIHPVGRLDAESTGALILTNDGDLTYWLTHPRHSIPKTYRVLVQGQTSDAVLELWRSGVLLDDRKTRPAKVRVIKKMPTQTRLEIILKEGRNRQIRRVAEQLGHPVIELHRTAIGSIQLQTTGQPLLPTGSYRYLEDFEIRNLHSSIEVDSKVNTY
ncbi:MAG: rRNA pseudouridine synthase [Calothrix sp. C42_A2020_038]|nr:rRNA pseudouridine synthase [Calothrix sp. C42_A2020_038]